MPQTRIKGVDILDLSITEVDINLSTTSVITPSTTCDFLLWDTINSVVKRTSLSNLDTYYNGKYSLVGHVHAESTITFTDITTGNASTTKHGYLPKLTGATTTFLRADGT